MRPPLRIRGAGTPDALPTGEYVVPIIGSHIATDKRRIERPLGQDIAYPRLHPNGEHFACQIHEGPQKDHVYEFVGVDEHGKDRWIDHGKWTSVSPCLYKPDGTLVINGRDGQWGSQGLRYVTDDGVVVSADDTYGSGVYGLSEFTPIRADIVVGQTHDNNRDDVAVYVGTRKNEQGHTVPDLRLLELGPCRFIREHHDGEQLSVAIWKPAVNPADGEAVLYWPTLAELRALPSMDVPKEDPTEDPTDDPKEPPVFTPIRLPDEAQAVVDILYERHRDLAHGDDDARRTLTKQIAEQVRFTLGPAWGWKAAGGPPSKDSIAKRDGGVLHGFDLFDGATRKPNDHPMSVDISTQTFIVVDAVNHLASGNGGDPDDPLPLPSTPGAAIDAELAAQSRLIADLLKRVAVLEQKPSPSQPVSINGTRVALKTDNGHYLCAEGGGGGDVNASRDAVGGWETLTIEVQR